MCFRKVTTAETIFDFENGFAVRADGSIKPYDDPLSLQPVWEVASITLSHAFFGDADQSPG